MAKRDKVIDISRGRPSGGRPSYVDGQVHEEPKESAKPAKGPLLEPSTPREPDWREWFGATKAAEGLRKRAREEWRRVVPELEASGTLSVVDRSLIADYCVSMAQIQVWNQQITREGAVQPGSRDGSLAKHPLTTPLNQVRGHARQLADKLMIGAKPRLAAGFSGGGAARPAAGDDGEAKEAESDDPFDV
ncbi:MAG: phage terminase small subunit P27 family [Mycobacterium sp.]